MKYRVVKFPSKSVNEKHTQRGSLLCVENDFKLLRGTTNPHTAYLNAPIDCEIYVDRAEGFEAP